MANEYHTYLSNLTFTYELVRLISVKKGRYRIIAAPIVVSNARPQTTRFNLG